MTRGARHTWTVVIVEDDPMVADLHRRLVASVAGFGVVGVTDTAEAALDIVVRGRPDLVLLDLGLPGAGGLSLLRWLRGHEHHTEVIAITATQRAEVVRGAVHLGVVDYLVKPFAPDRLRQALGLFESRMRGMRDPLLGQEAIDAVCGAGRRARRVLPKDLRPETMACVRLGLARALGGVTASDLADDVGLARVTARRYLEYLVTVEDVEVEAVPTGRGRPHKVYRLTASGRTS